MSIEIVRNAFEKVCYPNFGVTSGHSLRRNANGEYVSDSLEDHWQTFQEGWECAIEHLKIKSDPAYSDLVSDGGMDPRR